MENTKEVPLYQASAKEDKDIRDAMQFKQESSSATKSERTEWRNSYYRYKLSRYLSEYEYIPDVQLGMTYDAVERITTSLPGREFGFKAKAVGIEDTKNAILFSEVLNQAWNSTDIMDGPSKMDVVKKNMALFGNAFIQIYWDTTIDETGKVVKSDPCFVPLNVFDVYYNKFIPEIDLLPKIGYQSIVSLDWLKDNGKQYGYKNLKYVKGFTPSRSQGQDEDSSSIDQEESTTGKESVPTIAKLFEIQTDKEILTLALDDSGPIWLRKVPNQLGAKNIFLFRYKRHPLPNRLLGITDVSKGGNIEDSIQRAMNQAVFNSLLVDNPNFTYDATNQTIDPRTFVTAPGAGIPRGKDPDSITPIQFPSHLNESLELIATLKEQYKRIVNTPDIIAGDAKGNTATTDNLNDTNAKASTDKIVDGMKGTMQKIGSFLRRLYQVYGPESITVQVRTPELIEKLQAGATEVASLSISKDDLVVERDVDVTAEFTSQNKSVLSRRIVEWLSITAQDQTVPPQLRMQAYQKWLEFNDLDDLALAFAEFSKIGQTSDLALADQENQQMASGTALPSTPDASTAHTQRHVDFMRRAETGPEIDRLLQAHIEGELSASQAQAMPEGEQGGGVQTQSENPVDQMSAVGQV